MEKRYDVVIIGGGIGGLMAAYEACRGELERQAEALFRAHLGPWAGRTGSDD